MPPLERVINLLKLLNEPCLEFETCVDENTIQKYSIKIAERKVYIQEQYQRLKSINILTEEGAIELVKMHSELLDIYYGWD